MMLLVFRTLFSFFFNFPSHFFLIFLIFDSVQRCFCFGESCFF
ncbi:unnamed protein product [Spirodela intermedia]|uniref:Uncharacterized protein n=1 Tax=Spirodela intermedia TaxID=51605 RepID=A0A7I8JHE0_SPIIN|nr:unnamed protein product [Spirodela intermedia]CAA6669579.1 unnamed protein product [Spirodela intermedia]